ncbi:MFS general substrate transporter [Aspergillus steynii IBT 23096]|uniref:MFS general substrate transporter n=1 Tax=Aspergillus steynii IBT 23096 TaxID=1392250 RepID=A0A2I2FUE1_9EURO|nr:MFS general substrate transporter [Aspergillus steynii IBT 23096]PLB44221.1 MFS general substrate transporter [Aspergillus steynii IBT 23096]
MNAKENPQPRALATTISSSDVLGLNSDSKPENPVLGGHTDAGVRGIEAAVTVWTKTHMVIAYIIIWFVYFVMTLQEVIIRALNPYVTSAFRLHSLTAATVIMSNIIAGVSKIPLAKVLDTWGRPQGLTAAVFVWVMGFIMMALCNNVQTYAAAQVFYNVGFQAVSFCLTVFVSDTSSLKNRGLMLAYSSSSYIITSWVGGPISQSVLNGPGWRWGFGIFCIAIPAIVAPLCVLFFWNHHKARKAGLLPPSGGPLTLQRIRQYCFDVDLLGIILLAGGMALFLLPFSLYSYQGDQWRSPMVICMIIFGGLLILAFVLWEKFLAPKSFIPYNLLMDRTVLFGGLMILFNTFNMAIWGSYFSSMLQVVWDLNVTEASYVGAIYAVGSGIWTLAVGFLIRWTYRFKWLAVYFASPLMILGVGLMIHFRRPDADIGYICMTQIFNAFAGGTIVICGEIAMMAPSDHEHLAVILALCNLFSTTGTAIGSTVSAAIWTGTFSVALAKYLPSDVQVAKVYSDLTVQLSYPRGSEARDGISQAYGESQRYMLITSVCMAAVSWGCAWMWRDLRLKDSNQVGGRVI